MFRRFLTLGVALLMAFALTLPAFAQGTQTGTLRGTVRLDDGSAIPGVTVTATSPAIQGSRTTYTNENGEYLIRGLSPGDYTVTYELEGMATSEWSGPIALGQVTPIPVVMTASTQEETITVFGELPSVLASSQVSR